METKMKMRGISIDGFKRLAQVVATISKEEVLDKALEIARTSDAGIEEALQEASNFMDQHGVFAAGVEILPYAESGPLREIEFYYVNTGETYDPTICYTKEDGFFISSWGDWLEQAELEYAKENPGWTPGE
jgi:hypothetical protein